MRTPFVVATLALMLPCINYADEAGPGVKFDFGTTLNAVLSNTLDARKCRSGDAVRAKTAEDVRAGGVVVIPRGAKLVGHVTEAQPAASKNEQARLGFVFDRAELKDGHEVPLRTSFYALAAPEGAGGLPPSGGFGGGLGSGSSAVGDMMSASSNTDDTSSSGADRSRQEDLRPSPGAVGGLNGSGTLYASSRGVFGLEAISLEPNTVPSSGSTVILATARSVRLSSGTRMLLSVESAAQ
jgi:hypothetical protein